MHAFGVGWIRNEDPVLHVELWVHTLTLVTRSKGNTNTWHVFQCPDLWDDHNFWPHHET